MLNNIIILNFFLISAIPSLFSSETNEANLGSDIQKNTLYVEILGDIQKELKVASETADLNVCLKRISSNLQRLKSFDDQYAFAMISYTFFRISEQGYCVTAYEHSFFECLQMMAKDKSKEAADTLQRMKSKLHLDGGLGLGMDSAIKLQANPAYK